jgi:hypothetical protein
VNAWLDILGLALSALAASLLVGAAVPRGRLLAVLAWAASIAVLAARHGVFPGFSYAVAALTAVLSIAIVAAPPLPRAIPILRRGAALAAAASLVAAVIAGGGHG